MNRPTAGLLAIALLTASLGLLGGPVSASHEDAECDEEVDAAVDEDTCGRYASASLTGDAEGSCTGLCITASGTGNASNHERGAGLGACQVGAGCVAASGTGNASNDFDNRACGTGAVGCLALSGTGNASNDVGENGCEEALVGCVAVSGTGDSRNQAGEKSCQVGVNCIAVSGTGNASNEAGPGSCGTEALPSVSCVALSGTGNASNNPGQGSCGNPASCTAIEVQTLLDEHLPSS